MNMWDRLRAVAKACPEKFEWFPDTRDTTGYLFRMSGKVAYRGWNITEEEMQQLETEAGIRKDAEVGNAK